MRKTFLAMIRAYQGGWDAMAAALGMTRMQLENRIYERKGQSMLHETAMQMQAFSGTTLYAEGVAKESGGVFMRVPEAAATDRDDLLDKFNELYSELGALSTKFQTSASDGEIDSGEQAELSDVGQAIHRTVEELLSLTFKIYCKPESGR